MTVATLEPAVTADDIAWHDQALCRKLASPNAFFPPRGVAPDDAKEVCAHCPVPYDCLAYALEHGERFGVWGGLSERERRPLLRAYREHYPAVRRAAC